MTIPNIPHPLTHRFGFLLTESGRTLREKTEQALGPFRIIAREGAILELIAAEGPQTLAEISQRLKIDKKIISKLTEHLEQLALLKRMSHPTDGRSYSLHLTSKGSKVIRAGVAVADKCQDEYLSSLSNVEREIFRKILVKLFLQN